MALKSVLNELMLAHGYTPEQMAYLTERTVTSIYRLKKEDTVAQLDTLVMLCATFDCKIEDIYTDFYAQVEEAKVRILRKKELM